MVAYYPYGTYPYPQYVRMPMYDENTQFVMRTIQESIRDEREDELFYDYLISVAPTQAEKDVITGIRNDERKHRRWFREIYDNLFPNVPLPADQAETFQRPASYLEGLEQALFGELRAFERYRALYFLIPAEYENTIFEIMTDEMKHANYYNWLYAKNKS
jgi:rubrerythrin